MNDATTVRIPLRKRGGLIWGYALVDPEDYDRVSKHRWYWDGHYPRTSVPGQPGKKIRLHAFLLGAPPPGFWTDHINRNTLDNRRSNLRWVTPDESNRNSDSATARHARKTHCPQGHEYSGANLRTSNGGRFCRQCQRERARANYQANASDKRQRARAAYRTARENMSPEELTRFRAQRAASTRAYRARKQRGAIS